MEEDSPFGRVTKFAFGFWSSPRRSGLLRGSQHRVVMVRLQERTGSFRGFGTAYPTLTQFAEHFDRYDDILASFAKQIGQGYTISPVEAVAARSGDFEPPTTAPNVEMMSQADRRKDRIAQQAQEEQLAWEYIQAERQRKREEAADREWRAEEGRREAAAARAAEAAAMEEVRRDRAERRLRHEAKQLQRAEKQRQRVELLRKRHEAKRRERLQRVEERRQQREAHLRRRRRVLIEHYPRVMIEHYPRVMIEDDDD